GPEECSDLIRPETLTGDEPRRLKPLRIDRLENRHRHERSRGAVVLQQRRDLAAQRVVTSARLPKERLPLALGSIERRVVDPFHVRPSIPTVQPTLCRFHRGVLARKDTTPARADSTKEPLPAKIIVGTGVGRRHGFSIEWWLVG